MTSLLQISINLTNHAQVSSSSRFSKPCNLYSSSRNSICSFHRNEFGGTSRGERFQLGYMRNNYPRRKLRTVAVKFKQGPGLSGGDGPDTRVLTNIAIGVGVIYLSVTGQLGWILDAIVSVWLFVVILPIVGLVAYYLWATRDIIETDCPNCGNEFEFLESDVKDDMVQCPFCNESMSVVDGEYVPDPKNFYNQPNSFGQAFGDLSDFSRRSKQGKKKSTTIVDIEAEVKDAD